MTSMVTLTKQLILFSPSLGLKPVLSFEGRLE